MNDPTQTRRGYLAALGVVLCWSGFNIVSRFGSRGTFTPYDIAALRFGISALIALPFFLRLGRREDWGKYLLLALCGGIGYSLLAYAGFAHAPTSHAAVFVNGGIPLWTVLLLAVASGFRVAPMTLAALAVSLAGIGLIAWESVFIANGAGYWRGDGLFLLAAATWAIFGLLMRRWRIGPTTAITAVAVFSATLYLPIYFMWLPTTLAQAGYPAIALQGIYQGVIAALCAGWMYSYATQSIGPTQASMMLALVPGLSAMGGAWLLDEPIGGVGAIGILVVSAGALLGAMANRQRG